MFHAARSASPMGWPKPTVGAGAFCAIRGALAHAAAISALAATTATALCDGILDLPAGGDGPGEDAVVVLDEAGDGAGLLEVLHRRLHVARAVHRPAGDHGGADVPCPT